MAITAEKIELITTRDKAPILIEKIQRLGISEIVSRIDVSAEETVSAAFADTKELSSRLADLARARDLLSDFAPKSGFISSLILGFLPTRQQLQLDELEALIDDVEVEEALAACGDMRRELSETEKEEQAARDTISSLRPFSGISLSSSARDLRLFEVVAGTVSRSVKESFSNGIRDRVPASFLEWGSRTDGSERSFVAIFPKEESGAVRNLMEKWDISEQTVFWKDSVDNEIAALEERIRELSLRRNVIGKRAESLTGCLPKLEALIDWYSWELDKGRLLHEAGKTRIYMVLTFWIPSTLVDLVKRTVLEIAPMTLVRKAELRDGERPPVVMQNGSATKMFEIVTRIYGLPKADEPDPTPFLAPFFAVFFALALSDTGYGLLLLLASLGALRFVADRGARLFFKLFALCGVLTMVAGIVAGTVFGTEVAAGYRLIDPMGDPTGTLAVMFALGAFHLFVGLGIGFWWKSKQGEMRKALSGEGSAMMLFAGAALAVITGIGAFFVTGIFGMVLMSVVFSTDPGIAKRLVGGLAALYGIVGYFSDILSYSRLLALSLATGVIAMVINMIAFLFYEMVPVAGLNILVLILVLTVGHTVNFMISGLGAFVHSARLQFVEYFSKFMEGGGREFQPFSKQGKYVEVIADRITN